MKKSLKAKWKVLILISILTITALIGIGVILTREGATKYESAVVQGSYTFNGSTTKDGNTYRVLTEDSAVLDTIYWFTNTSNSSAENYDYYCLNGGRSFGRWYAGKATTIYTHKITNVDNLDPNDSTDYQIIIQRFGSVENYRAFKWIIENMYVQTNNEVTDEYIVENIKDFGEFGNLIFSIDNVSDKNMFDVMNQLAIWRYTNNDISDYNIMADDSNVLWRISKNDKRFGIFQNMILVKYYNALIEGAENAKSNASVDYGIQDNQEFTDNYNNVVLDTSRATVQHTAGTTTYIAGPYKITKGVDNKYIKSQNLTVSIANGTEIKSYSFTNKAGTAGTNPYNEQDYYIKFILAEELDVVATLVQTYQISYTRPKVDVIANAYYNNSSWRNSTNQQILEITKQVSNSNYTTGGGTSIPATTKPADLVLVSDVVNINGTVNDYNTNKLNSLPVYTADDYYIGTFPSTTSKGTNDLTYKANKLKISVNAESYFKYRIKVCNEGETDGYVKQIKTYLPEGVTYLSCASSKPSVNVSQSGNILTITVGGSNRLAAYNGTLSSFFIDVTCKLNTGLNNNSELIIRSEISDYGAYSSSGAEISAVAQGNKGDIDSHGSTSLTTITDYINLIKERTPNAFSQFDSTSSTAKADKNTYDIQDDDDFIRLQVNAPKLDVSLKKTILSYEKQGSKHNVVDRYGEIYTYTNGVTGQKGIAAILMNKKALTLNLQPGDTITYGIDIYNEGEIDALGYVIKDYLPSGLELDSIEGYTKIAKEENFWSTTGQNEYYYDSTNNIVYIKLGAEGLIPAFTGDNATVEKLQKNRVRIETTCKITDSAPEQTPLVNIAEIYRYKTTANTNVGIKNNVIERSQPNGVIRNDIDSTGENVDRSNYNAVTTNNYPFTTGQEDDDDYESFIIDAKLDFALRKYISKVTTKDGQTTEYDRNSTNEITSENNGYQSVLDVTSQGSTVRYNNKKTPVKVNVGDKVTYTIRVYNEGERNGYVKQISDYLPKGLELAQGSEINSKYGWTVNTAASIDGRTKIETNYLQNDEIPITSGNGLNGLYTGYMGYVNNPYITGDKNISAIEWYERIYLNNDASQRFYRDVQIECVVTDDYLENNSNTYLVNVAEITDYGCYVNGTYKSAIVINEDTNETFDRDSIQENWVNEEVIENDAIVEKNTKTIQKYLSEVISNELGTSKVDQITDSTVLEGLEDDDDFEILEAPQGLDITFTIDKTALENSNEYIQGVEFSITEIIDGTIKDESTKTYETDEYGYITLQFNNINTEGTYSYLISETNIENSKVISETNSKESKSISKIQNNFRLDVTVVFNEELYKYEIEKIVLNQIQDGNVISSKDVNPGDANIINTPLENGESVNTRITYTAGQYITLTIPNKTKEFDLALQKFITKTGKVTVNSTEEERVYTDITGREPVYDVNTQTYSPLTEDLEPVKVENGDLVEYTIRVYNEGELNGFAEEIMDDIPEHLEFLPNNEINTTYGWKMFRKVSDQETLTNKDETNKTIGVDGVLRDYMEYNGDIYVITENSNEADFITTNYLSNIVGNEIRGYVSTGLFKVDENPNLLLAKQDGQDPDYRDVKVVFKVNQTDASGNVLKMGEQVINSAQITQDKAISFSRVRSVLNVQDKDSTPNVWEENPRDDDQDTEKVSLKSFDLALKKCVTTATVVKDGEETVIQGNTNPTEEKKVINVEIPKSKINDVEVKFKYIIRVENEGELAGYATQIIDNIPDGLKFDSEDTVNQKYGWTEVDGKVVTDYLKNTLLQPKDSSATNQTNNYQDLEIVFTWINSQENMKLIQNIAEIGKDYNETNTEDIDSTPGNSVMGEDDIDTAEVNLITLPEADIVLTKEILSIDGKEYTTDDYEIENTDSSLSTTDKIFKSTKPKVIVKPGSKIVYRLAVYNEGDTKAYVSEIKDYLPQGLTYETHAVSVQEQTAQIIYNDITSAIISKTETDAVDGGKVVTFTINQTAGDNGITLEPATDSLIQAFYIDVTCTVSNDIENNLQLFNRAEVSKYGADINNQYVSAVENTSEADRDSYGATIINTITDYINEVNANHTYLTDIDKKGLTEKVDKNNYDIQDDDDFARIFVYVPKLDVALKKTVIGYERKDSSEPVIGTDRYIDIKENEDGTITYEMEKYQYSNNFVAGDKIYYSIDLYNEGQIEAIGYEIKDCLPEELRLISITGFTGYLTKDEYDEDTTNNCYYYDESANIVYIKLGATSLIPAYTNVATLKDNRVRIETKCEIKENTGTGEIIKNVAEITKYKTIPDTLIYTQKDTGIGYVEVDSTGIVTKDIDSTADSLTSVTNYTTNIEDDDDYEQIVLDKNFDLALRKFVTKVQNTEGTTETNYDRAPKFLGELKQTAGLLQDGTAPYDNSKQPIKVNVGDIITYKLRVYNEGYKSGYATEITDYLPAGLVLVDNSTHTDDCDCINCKYGWEIDQTYTQDGITKVKTNYLQYSDTQENIIEAMGTDKFLELVTLYTSYTIEQAFLGGETLDAEQWYLQVYLADNAGIQPFYRDVEIQCQVTEDIFLNEGLLESYLVNVAEITNYGYYNDGTYVQASSSKIDTDSVQNNVLTDGQTTIQTYLTQVLLKSVGTGMSLTSSSIIYGIEDDDDFEILQVPKKLGFNLKVEKVDSKDENYGIDGVKFKVNDVDYVTADGGVITLDTLKTKETQDISFIISETDIGTNNILAKIRNDLKLNVKVEFNENSWAYEVKEISLNEVIDGQVQTNSLYVEGAKTAELVAKLDDEDTVNVRATYNEETGIIDLIVPNKTRIFDLALQKFITEIGKQDSAGTINYTEVTDRIPSFSIANGNYVYGPTEETLGALEVENNDIVVYTLRVYNEGEIDGYAETIMDDIPQNLEFLPNNEINTTYGWEITQDGKYVVTNYLSKQNGTTGENQENKNLIKYFDVTEYSEGKISGPDYKDVKIAFKVIKPSDNSEIVNYAQITQDMAVNSIGEQVQIQDKDSTPNVWEESPRDDDQDIEKISVKQFDLALKKCVTSAVLTDKETGDKKEYQGNQNPDDGEKQVINVQIPESKIDEVTLEFKYMIRVYNQGEIAGSVTEIKDIIPDGLKYVETTDHESDCDCTNCKYRWTVNENGYVTSNYLKDTILEPGQYADVEIVYTWINNSENAKEIINIAEINEDYNSSDTPDEDSVPGNGIETEDDIDTAEVTVELLSEADFVLTKEILSIDGNKYTKDDYVVEKQESTLSNLDLIYKSNKTKAVVEPGSQVVYRIAVYNEGKAKGYVSEIKDYLPEGLKYISYEIPNLNLEETNSNYIQIGLDGDITGINTEVVADYNEEANIVTFAINSNQTLKGIPMIGNSQVVFYIDVICEVEGTVENYTTLVNRAEISNYASYYNNIYVWATKNNPEADRDSYQDTELYTVEEYINKVNELHDYLTNIDKVDTDEKVDKNNYDIQDDDDFARIEVNVPTVDISLKKTINSIINKESGFEYAVDPSRCIEITEDESGNIIFEMDKSVYEGSFAAGDTIKYGLNIYNEGEVDALGYEIKDYIPAGLKLTNIKLEDEYAVDFKRHAAKSDYNDDDTNNCYYYDEEDNIVYIKLGSQSLIKPYTNIEDLKANSITVVTECTIEQKALTGQVLTNVAEIINYKVEANTNVYTKDGIIKSTEDKGLIMVDIDSKADSITSAEDYTTNEQDDDDFEKIKIPSTSKISLKIEKVSKEDKETKIPGVTFDVNGTQYVTATGENEGTIEINDISLDKQGTLTYIISETDIGENNILAKLKNKLKLNINVGLNTSTYRYEVSGVTLNEVTETGELENPIEILNITGDYAPVTVTLKETGRDDERQAIAKAKYDAETATVTLIIPNETKEFDLALFKSVTSAILIKDGKETVIDGNTNPEAEEQSILNVEIPNSKINEVDLRFKYTIRVKNEGQESGYVKQITDYIPDGLEFAQDDQTNINNAWNLADDGKVTTSKLADVLLAPGETRDIEIVFKWINSENNLKTMKNIAEISEDFNESGKRDIDSTPNNQAEAEDDYDTAEVSVIAFPEADLVLTKEIISVDGVPYKDGIVAEGPQLYTQDDYIVEKQPSEMSLKDYIYKSNKSKVAVEPGATVIYRIAVYNEGEQMAYVSEVKDYLPTGLNYVSHEVSISKTENGILYKGNFETKARVDENNIITFAITNVNENQNENLGQQLQGIAPDVMEGFYIDVTCKVAENIENDTVLVNRAEISNYGTYINGEYKSAYEKDSEADRDSYGVTDLSSIEQYMNKVNSMHNYLSELDNNNRTEKVDKNNYDIQDDDDFARIEVKVPKIDIALKKTIIGATKSGVYNEVNRYTSIVQDLDGTIDYNMDKSTYTGNFVEEDKIIYALDLYNEGEIEALGFEIKDYLPEQLKLTSVKNFTPYDSKQEYDNDNTSNCYYYDEENNIVYIKLGAEELIEKYTNINDLQNNRVRIETECEIRENTLTGDSIINIAEIIQYKTVPNVKVETKDGISEVAESGMITSDMDSTPNTIKGISDLYNSNIEDDDDFETIRLPKNSLMNIQIEKVDSEDHNKKINDVTFDINGTQYVTSKNDEKQGTIKIESIDIDSARVYTYEISEVDVGDNNILTKLENSLKMDVEVKFDEEKYQYVISNIVLKEETGESGIENQVKISNINRKATLPVKLENGGAVAIIIKYNKEVGTINLTIPNKTKKFDLALEKSVTKAIVIEDGKETIQEAETPTEQSEEPILKIDLAKSKVDNVVVKFEYEIKVTNEGDMDGFTKEISDYIPEGMKFDSSDVTNIKYGWEQKEGKVTTKHLENKLLQPGESDSVKIVLTWINGQDNMGIKENIAEISKHYNDKNIPDVDSTPNNFAENEDDIDDASVMMTVKTGSSNIVMYMIVGLLAVVILIIGIIIIKRFVLILY